MEMGRKAIYSLEMVGSTNKAEGKEATVILTTSRKDNMNTKRRDWVIKKGDLLQFINEQKPDDAHKYETIFADLDDKILVESITGFICKNAIKYTKQEKDGELLLKYNYCDSFLFVLNCSICLGKREKNWIRIQIKSLILINFGEVL